MMKNKYILCLFISIVFSNFIFFHYVNATELDLNDITHSLQEVANAYYTRGDNIQYCDYRASYYLPPEEATSQNTLYQVCNVFVSSIYYQAFGVILPGSTHEMIAYAHEYYDANNISTNDVIEYWEKKIDGDGNITYYDNAGNVKDIDLSTEEERQKYVVKLLNDYHLQVGDLFVTHSGINGSNSGHVLIIYDITYNSNGEPTNAIIREAISSFNKNSTKLSPGLSRSSVRNDNYNINEGALWERKLRYNYHVTSSNTRDSVVYRIKDANYFAIIRPLLKDSNNNYTGKYYYSTFQKSNNTEPTGYIVLNRELMDYNITQTTQKRINYSKIYIEKTVNVFNKSTVNLDDELEYNIRIKNNSESAYSDFDVIEEISKYVELIDSNGGSVNNNQVTWHVTSLNPGQEITINYKVKVKNNESSLGKEIISTGSVAGIPSSTVKNKINNNFTHVNQLSIKKVTQNIINDKNYKSKELISKIFNELSTTSIDLDDFEIEQLLISNNTTTYYPTSELGQTGVMLNSNNTYRNMVLDNYYGSLYVSTSGYASFKRWENYKYLNYKSRDLRNDTIRKENFKTGDILIYKNEQVTNENVTYETESGYYYLIYIDDDKKITVGEEELSGFIGRDSSGVLKNIKTDYLSMQTLLGKDYYVILRPSMVINEIEDLPITTNDIFENIDYNYLEDKHIMQINDASVNQSDYSEKVILNSGFTIQVGLNDNGKVYTGSKSRIYSDNQLVLTIVNSLKGDVNGDGKVNSKDYVKIRKHIMESTLITGDEYTSAADYNSDNQISSKDYVKIRKYLMSF